MKRRIYLVISGIIFGLVACMHLLRVLFGLQVQIGTWIVPIWLSWGGLFGASILCIGAFLSIRGDKTI